MTHIAVHAESLSKRYQIGEHITRYNTLRDLLSHRVRSWAGNARRLSRPSRRSAREEVWALKDVSFEVERGDIVGVIGRNGAGKSTLLKVLARITEPTHGHARLMGRVGSLLEVGTGFHPELTGRENVQLSSAILGMRRADVARKFDEIVEFAEVARFIDTPVKHYSSGMYLKLAFAVAAHLEPDILLVDEVLAVGDVAFQRKCLGKMSDVSREGRTVLFVSHNMSAVTQLCRRGLLMHNGRGTVYETAADAVAEYLSGMNGDAPDTAPTTGMLSLGQVRIDATGTDIVRSGEQFEVEIPVHANEIQNPWMFLIVEDSGGRTILHSRIASRDIGVASLTGSLIVRVHVPPLWLSPGLYSLYFKFLIPSVDGGGGKVSSERVVLHVSGDFDQTGKAALTPHLGWQVRHREEVTARSDARA